MITKFIKTQLTPKVLDNLRINLSAVEKKLSLEPVCDFCGSPSPIWVYHAERMSTGAPIPCWRWCACGVCSTLIDLNDWKTIMERVIDKTKELFERHGHPTTRVDLVIAATISFREFRVYASRQKGDDPYGRHLKEDGT